MARRNGPAMSCLASALMAAGAFATVDGHAMAWTLPASVPALSVQDDDAEDADWQDDSGEYESESAGEEEQAADASEAEDESWDEEPADESAEESGESEADASAEEPAPDAVDETSAPEEEEAEAPGPGDAEPEAATAPEDGTEPESTTPEPSSPPPPLPANPPAEPAPMVPGGVAPRSWEDPDDKTIYRVVISFEEQYSIWPVDRDIPLGWTDAGKRGSKQEVLAYIQEVWTDMRPSSLRKKMEELERERQKDGGQ